MGVWSVHDSDVNLGILWIAPQGETRDCYHVTRHCPRVVPGFQFLEPGDGGYSHIQDVLPECEWCWKYFWRLVDPIERKSW